MVKILPERHFVSRSRRVTSVRKCVTAGKMSNILLQDIQQLLERFAKSLYSAKGCENDDIVDRCAILLRLDYSVVEIPNPNGDLSTHYPSRLLIPEYEKRNPPKPKPSDETRTSDGQNANTPLGEDDPDQRATNRNQVIVDGKVDVAKLKYLISRARLARCRARFPLPVILYKEKYVCRSATLSGGPEIYGRSGLEYLAYAPEAAPPEPGDEAYDAQIDSSSDESDSERLPLFGRLRRRDIRLLNALNVGTIIDFMVENKKVKFGMNVTSSEKIDKQNRYGLFEILALPYPGCEFFREYRDNNYHGKGLIFDWNQSYVDAGIRVPSNSVAARLNINWNNYKQWDLVQITKNYIRLLVNYMRESDSGILVHCISGWDRTPLFVSLLRISLWADGVIHQSLDAAQMLYFTIAYDWLLFGHHLPDRMSKGEVIFYFCFYVIKKLYKDDYSILTHRFRSHHSSSGSSSIDVISSDVEQSLENLLIDNDLRGSTVSLNSTSSFASGRSSSIQDPQTCVSAGIGLTTGSASNSIAIANRNGDTRNRSVSGGVCNGDGSSMSSLNGNNGFSSFSQESGSSIGCISQDSSNHNNQWSPPPKRTSPVTVPIASRQRQESSSSLSVGSWQMVNCTGSLRSADSVNDVPQSTTCPCPHQHASNHPHNLQLLQSAINTSTTSSNTTTSTINHQLNPGPSTGAQNHAYTPNANQLQQHTQETTCCLIINGECYPNRRVDLFALRRDRLTELRTMFFNCYYSTIAFQFPSSADMTLGSLMENFVEKIGLTSRPPA